MARKGPELIVAEDDDDDFLLVAEALQAAEVRCAVTRVKDGQELLDLLRAGGNGHAGALILLDLNMPRMDGREALQAIKADERLRRIPVVVLTTSKDEEDVARSYDLGANSYVRKPAHFSELVEIARRLGRFWFDTAELPRPALQEGGR